MSIPQPPFLTCFSEFLALGRVLFADEAQEVLAHFEEKTYPTHALLVGKETHNYLMFLETGLVTEQRLSYFYAKNPRLANRVPLKCLASYLNITPTHLSRIRRKLATHPK